MTAPADRPALAGLAAGSLCSGIGALDLAVEACGARICWQAETDPYCTAVLARHWPHLPNHGDIKVDQLGGGR